MSLSFLVLGVARDCQKSISKTLTAITKVLPPESRISVYVVESDSKDETASTLRSLSETHSSFNFISLGKLSNQEPNRLQRIAKCRNAYMEYLDKELSEGKKFDHVIVVDFDGVNTRIKSRQPIDELLSKSKVICANQLGRYYDILALRQRGWVDEDYQLKSKIDKRQGIDPILSHLKNVARKQIRIPASSDGINVESAFGGLAIFPTDALAGLRYSADLLAFEVYQCEHVSFNEQVRKRGYEIQISPGLQNRGSIRHTLLAHFPIDLIAFSVGNLRRLIRNLMN